MIYAPQFDALPPSARDAIYARLWTVLSGKDRSTEYSNLTGASRTAIVEILRATKPGLPGYFTPAPKQARSTPLR